MTIPEIKAVVGSEIWTLTQYLKDRRMERLHGQRFRKMIEALTETLKHLQSLEKLQQENAILKDKIACLEDEGD